MIADCLFSIRSGFNSHKKTLWLREQLFGPLDIQIQLSLIIKWKITKNAPRAVLVWQRRAFWQIGSTLSRWSHDLPWPCHHCAYHWMYKIKTCLLPKLPWTMLICGLDETLGDSRPFWEIIEMLNICIRLEITCAVHCYEDQMRFSWYNWGRYGH